MRRYSDGKKPCLNDVSLNSCWTIGFQTFDGHWRKLHYIINIYRSIPKFTNHNFPMIMIIIIDIWYTHLPTIDCTMVPYPRLFPHLHPRVLYDRKWHMRLNGTGLLPTLLIANLHLPFTQHILDKMSEPSQLHPQIDIFMWDIRPIGHINPLLIHFDRSRLAKGQVEIDKKLCYVLGPTTFGGSFWTPNNNGFGSQ